MNCVSALRLRLLALALTGAAAIGFGAFWATAAASQSAQDPRTERSEPPKLDELLNRFPIGTERVLESPEPAAPEAAVSPPQGGSGAESMWIAVLAGVGAVVILTTLGAVALHRGRERSTTQATSTSAVALLEQALAVAHQDVHPAGTLAHSNTSVSRIPQTRSPRQPEPPPAEAEQRQPPDPQADSEPVREQRNTRADDVVAAIAIDEVPQPAENGGVVQRDEHEALGPADEMDYVERNRAAWERWAPGYAAAGRKAWQDQELLWGIWGTPESALRIFEGLEPGGDVVELGCGTAAVCGWLARRGARPVAIDIAPTQLRTADTLQREFGLSFPLICANAERVPLEEASFDLAISEYGTSLWCDPRHWLAEAQRLLRPGGRLVFLTNGALLMACTPSDGGPAGYRLVRDYFSAERVEFPGDDAVEFHPTHGDWVRLLRTNGFILEDLIEVRPPPTANATRFEFAPLDWARRWPSEEIWVARKVE